MKKLHILFLFKLLLLLTNTNIQAQVIKVADEAYYNFNYKKAIDLYEYLLAKDSTNNTLNHKLADSYRLTNNSEKSEYFYSLIIQDSNEVKPIDYFYYAKSLQLNKKYKDGEIWMNKYAEFNSEWTKNINSSSDFLNSLKKDSLCYNIFSVNTNSKLSDLGASFFKDKIVYSSAREIKTIVNRKYGWNSQSYLSLYVSDVASSGDFVDIDEFVSEFKTNYHDGPVCFNKEGNEIFITRNFLSNTNKLKKTKEQVVNLMIYHSIIKDGKWTKPQLMNINLEGFSTGHPSLSDDGNTLYFTSDRPGGLGGKDIYMAKRMGSRWSHCINLGPRINTSGDDMFPFISEDNILFFSSNGYPGLGGLDIFYNKLSNNNKTVNIGAKINSNKDDFGLIIKDGKGYFASNRKKGETYDDIYRVEIVNRVFSGLVINRQNNSTIPNAKISVYNNKGLLVDTKNSDKYGRFEFILPNAEDYTIMSEKNLFDDSSLNIYKSEITNLATINKTIYHSRKEIKNHILTGTVYNGKTKQVLGNTIVSLCNYDNEVLEQVVTDKTGRYRLLLTEDKNYSLISEKQFFEDGKTYILKTVVKNSKTLKRDIYQAPVKIEVDKVFVMNNIYYDINKSKIRRDAELELDKLLILLNTYPKMEIELSSHTDSRGSSKYNTTLSHARAIACVQYLISKGINKKRLKAKGYGESKLLNKCADGIECSDLEHQKNRRTEVKVLKVD